MSLPDEITPYGTRTPMTCHIRRLEAQVEAYIHSHNPNRQPASSEKAAYLLLSLPHDGYWFPFTALHAHLYAQQVIVEIHGGVPNFATWEEMVPLVKAHDSARPFYWEKVPIPPRLY